MWNTLRSKTSRIWVKKKCRRRKHGGNKGYPFSTFRAGIGTAVCGMDYLLIPDAGQGDLPSRTGRLFFNRNPATTNTVATSSDAVAVTVPPPQKPSVPQLVVTSDRFCGGRFSFINSDGTTRPIFAKVNSNLISLRVKTSSAPGAKHLRVNGHNRTLQGYRITYHQMQDCDWTEKDLVTRSNPTSLFQTLNELDHSALPTKLEDELALSEEERPQNSVGSIMASPDADGSLIHRIGNVSLGGSVEADDNDSLWDYLDDSWEAKGLEDDSLYQHDDEINL